MLCTRSELRNQFSFFVENVRFAIFHPKLALPPPPVSKCVTFRKNCELMRCSLTPLVWVVNFEVDRVLTLPLRYKLDNGVIWTSLPTVEV